MKNKVGKQQRLASQVVIQYVKPNTKIAPQPFLWKTREQLLVRICDMHDHHLANAINFCRNTVLKRGGNITISVDELVKQRTQYAGGEETLAEFQFQDLFDQAIGSAMPIFAHMLYEAARRGFVVLK